MSDTVKLIISIDSRTYNDIKVGKIYSSLRDVPLESTNAIKNGIPLDSVKAEINSAKVPKNRMSFFRDGIDCALQILDNIGKAESDDKIIVDIR